MIELSFSIFQAQMITIFLLNTSLVRDSCRATVIDLNDACLRILIALFAKAQVQSNSYDDVLI